MVKAKKVVVKQDPTREKAFRLILEACKLLKWEVATPDVRDDEECPGLIMGTKDFMAEYTEPALEVNG